MNEEQTFAEIGGVERAAQVVPERWRRLAEGACSASEVAALEAEAARDPQAALLWDRFRPLDAGDEDAIAEAMIAAQRAPARRGPPRWLGASVAAAAAAAAAVWVAVPAPATLPEYALSASTGDLEHRGDAEASDALPRHHQDSALTLVLTPATSASVPVAAQAFLLDEARSIDLGARFQISSEGAVRLDAKVSDLLGERCGPQALLLLVRPRALEPQSAATLRAAIEAGVPPPGTRWMRYRMQVLCR